MKIQELAQLWNMSEDELNTMIKNIIGRAKEARIPFRVLALIMAIVVLCAGTVFAATGESYIVDIYEGSQITRVETSLKSIS